MSPASQKTGVANRFKGPNAALEETTVLPFCEICLGLR
jgi:hypothetical protein